MRRVGQAMVIHIEACHAGGGLAIIGVQPTKQARYWRNIYIEGEDKARRRLLRPN